MNDSLSTSCIINLETEDELSAIQGFATPAPSEYWPHYPLYPHQARAVREAAKHQSAIMMSRSGVGRTTSGIVAAAESLEVRHEVERVIVVTPRTLLGHMADEITKVTGCDDVLRVTTSSLSCTGTPQRWIVVPYSLVNSVSLELRALASTSLVMVDHASDVKNPKSQRSKAVTTIAKASSRRLVLGTSVAMTPSEWLGVILKIVDPELQSVSGIDLSGLTGGSGPHSPSALLRARQHQFGLSDAQLELAIVLAPTWHSSLTRLAETVALLLPKAQR
jgi:hypothetical protein